MAGSRHVGNRHVDRQGVSLDPRCRPGRLVDPRTGDDEMAVGVPPPRYRRRRLANGLADGLGGAEVTRGPLGLSEPFDDRREDSQILGEINLAPDVVKSEQP